MLHGNQTPSQPNGPAISDDQIRTKIAKDFCEGCAKWVFGICIARVDRSRLVPEGSISASDASCKERQVK